MKSTFLVATVAVAAALFSVGASAQTGRPSAIEVKAAAIAPTPVAADEALGSYARYLMLNGATREEALVAARNVDHPVVRSRVATQGRTPADAKAPIRQ